MTHRQASPSPSATAAPAISGPCSVMGAAAHSSSEHVAGADVVIVAAGCPDLVPGVCIASSPGTIACAQDWIKPGAVVVDVGITRLSSGRIVGDVQFDAARRRAAHITPGTAAWSTK